MTGIHNHYWCFLPNIYEAPPQTDALNIIFSEQDGYNTINNCAGCRSYDKTPLVFVSGASGAFTKTTEKDFEFGDLTNLPIDDADYSYQAGNIPKINLAKADKMGRVVKLAGKTADFAKNNDGGPVDIPPPGKRAGFYNPPGYGNLFNWLFYKHHEDIFCSLPDGRTFDNAIKLENNDRGNISYGRERRYIADIYTDEEINEKGLNYDKYNKKQHTLMIQMDPRTIWNTHRTTMNLPDNASRQYAEWPPKRPYYGGMGGVVGGTDTLSPISYAAANRSDYQKEAGTNFLPCCSRTDGSMSSTCPYPVHDFRFNFQEPVDRYPQFNDYIPGRASFAGTVTISRSGSLPKTTNAGSSDLGFRDISEEECQRDISELVPASEEAGGGWRYVPVIKQCCGPFSSKWNDQENLQFGNDIRLACLTEKDFIEASVALSLPAYVDWDNDSYRFDGWKPRADGLFYETYMYQTNKFSGGERDRYYNTFTNTYDGGCGGEYLYGRIVKEVSINEDDYYYNSTYIDFYEDLPTDDSLPPLNKFAGWGPNIYKVPEYPGRYCDDENDRGWFGLQGLGILLHNVLFSSTGDALNVPPEDIPNFGSANEFTRVLEKNNLIYYDGNAGVMYPEAWLNSLTSSGFTADAYVTARTKFKKEVDLYERHPAHRESFKNYDYTFGGEPPPGWDWGADNPPWSEQGEWDPDATGYCYTFGDALYNEDGQIINGGDPGNLSIGSCCWTDIRPESDYYGRKFCFDPWYMNLGTPYAEAWQSFYTAQGFFDPYTAARIFFAKAVCDCIGGRENIDAQWHDNTTCMLNDGSISDAFPSYYEDYLEIPRGSVQSSIAQFSHTQPSNPYSYWRYGINDENRDIIYNPSPCGGQYKIWPCDQRGPTWHPRYMFSHFPGEAIRSWEHNSGQHTGSIPVGANTWPDPRVNSFFSQFGDIGSPTGISTWNTDAGVHCLKVPDGYGILEGRMPGETGPYAIEVSAGDFPWDDCSWPWSRHSYSAYDYPGGCSTYVGPSLDFGRLGSLTGTPSDEALRIFPDDPLHQRRMLSRAGFDPNGDRNELLAAIDSKCEGFKSFYENSRPTASYGSGNNGFWERGVYVDLDQGLYDNNTPGGEAPLIRPSVPSIGLGNYSPFPSINAGRLSDLEYQASPKRRIRFQTWSRWKEWVPWTNFTPIIMNHLERWIMPGRTQNLNKISIYLPKGVHAFGRGDVSQSVGATDTNLVNSDLYFPENVTDYSFPLRGINQGCVEYYGSGTTGGSNPFVLDNVPGHLLVDGTGPDFPYGFDLSGTRKTLNYLLRKINPDIEIEWLLYPERDVSSIYAPGVSNRGTAQNNAGIFLGEIIYQTCAYGNHIDQYGNTIWNEHSEQCLQFLDPYKTCTDAHHIMYPLGYQASLDEPEENATFTGPYWEGARDGGSPWFIHPEFRKYAMWLNGPGIREYTEQLFPLGNERWNVKPAEWMTDELKTKLYKYEMWTGNNSTGWMLDTNAMIQRNYTETSNDYDWSSDTWTKPCRFTSYRPSIQLLYDKLYELHPDLWTDVFDLDPYNRPLRTFNTKKYLTGYYDIINEERELIGVTGGAVLGTVKERYIVATGPPPMEQRYPTGEMSSIQDLVDKKKHPDFGWGVDGDSIDAPILFPGQGNGDFDWSSLTWRDVVEIFYKARFYDYDANPGYKIQDFLDKAESTGADLEKSVFSNDCGDNNGGMGCFFTQGCAQSCRAGEGFGDCNYIDFNDEPQQEEYSPFEDCNSTVYPGYDHDWVEYIDEPVGCCEGSWNMFYGEVEVWNYDDEETRAEIAAGPSDAPSFQITNTYPTFWDTMNYSCLSFGTGIMHWAHEKAQGTITFNDPWYQKYFLPVLSQFWESNLIEDFGDGSGNVPSDSPWLVKNGGCIPFEGGSFEEGFLYSQFGNEYDRGMQMSLWDSNEFCYQNSSKQVIAAGGFACSPRSWKYDLFSSTHWHPERRIITMNATDFDDTGWVDPYRETPIVAYPEILEGHRNHGRQLLPSGLEGVTRRSKGGYKDYGFGPAHEFITSLDYRDNMLDGQYEIVDSLNMGDIDNVGVITDGIDLSMERYDPEDPDGTGTHLCGPPDAPYPCITRFVRPNTDIWWTDKHGMTSTYEGGTYKKLESISPRGVGKPIELVKGYNGHGSYNNHGHGNTFDFRYAYQVKKPNDQSGYHGWTDRVKMVHHSGKELPINIKQLNDNGSIKDYGNGRD